MIYSAVGVAVLGVAGFMIYQALSNSLVYFIIPSEYAKSPEQYQGERLRLGGIVEAGSIDYNAGNLQLAFKISDSIESYPVVYEGSPPELFQANTGVVVEGRFVDGTFMSDRLLIKHSENYRPPESGEPINLEVLKDSLQ